MPTWATSAAGAIQWAWCGLVLPALALNYLGQGALLMAEPSAIDNPFYRLFPPALLVPALVLATLAAIIASQAVISGAYSMTRQAMQLGFLPRLTVRHTSASAFGQIYMPGVNTALLLGVVAVVLGFGSSSALAGAYGLGGHADDADHHRADLVRGAPRLGPAGGGVWRRSRCSSWRWTCCWWPAAR